jgi:hypothetical protein
MYYLTDDYIVMDHTQGGFCTTHTYPLLGLPSGERAIEDTITISEGLLTQPPVITEESPPGSNTPYIQSLYHRPRPQSRKPHLYTLRCRSHPGGVVAGITGGRHSVPSDIRGAAVYHTPEGVSTLRRDSHSSGTRVYSLSLPTNTPHYMAPHTLRAKPLSHP